MKRLLCLSWMLALGLVACNSAVVPTPVPVPIRQAAPGGPTEVRSAEGLTLPGNNLIADWTISTPAQTYHSNDLFNLVDGQADAFFAYNFAQVTTQRYENTNGTLLTVELWQLAEPADAYGLFTLNRAGSPVTMGNEGDADPGRRVAFWQDRYYVVVNANKAVQDVQVMAFADAISISLPKGGEIPALVKNLPSQGLTARGFIYFHQEISMRDEVPLSGDNLLGLSAKTNGVVARYSLDGTPAHLLLIQYPDPSQATAALQALRKAQDIDLMTADVKGQTLAAVVGKANQAAGTTLLQSALGGVQP